MANNTIVFIDKFRNYIDEKVKIEIKREKEIGALFPAFSFKVDKKQIEKNIIQRATKKIKEDTLKDIEKEMGNIFG
jgi:hypothetical protein